MIYQYNGDYYIKMTRKFVKINPSLDKNGDVDFTPTNEVIELSDINNVYDYKEISLNDVKQNLLKKVEVKEIKDAPTKKVSRFNKII